MDLFPCVKSNLKFMHPFLNVYIPDGKYNVTREGFLHLLECVQNYIWIQKSSRKRNIQSRTSHSK